MNGPEALYVNAGCFRLMSGMNLSFANKNLFTISFIVYLWKTAPNIGILFKGKLGTTNDNSLVIVLW